MSRKTATVSQLVNYLKKKLDQDALIQKIVVQGEISNFTSHRSGHWYFTLKDDQSRIACVMFQGNTRNCKIMPKNGDKVLAMCNTSLFVSSGQLQLYVTAMQLDGIGDLYYQFEQLKIKLSNEGLFMQEHKLSIPNYPEKIALITGNKTAAREDVVSTLVRRWPLAQVQEFHTLVQGDQAPQQIVEAIFQADIAGADVILLVRGGGSIEDLWAFNDELVAHAIYNCKTPIVVGVGHEIDVTIADYVADLRAPTPTGAAEMITPVLSDEVEFILKQKQMLSTILNHRLLVARKEVDVLSKSKVFLEPDTLFQMRWMKLDYLTQKLSSFPDSIHKKRFQFDLIKKSIFQCILTMTHDASSQITANKHDIVHSMNQKLTTNRNQFISSCAKLDAYSPLKSLSRGYSLPYQKDCVVTSVNDVDMNQTMDLIFSDGKLVVQPINKEDNHE